MFFRKGKPITQFLLMLVLGMLAEIGYSYHDTFGDLGYYQDSPSVGLPQMPGYNTGGVGYYQDIPGYPSDYPSVGLPQMPGYNTGGVGYYQDIPGYPSDYPSVGLPQMPGYNTGGVGYYQDIPGYPSDYPSVGLPQMPGYNTGGVGYYQDIPGYPSDYPSVGLPQMPGYNTGGVGYYHQDIFSDYPSVGLPQMPGYNTGGVGYYQDIPGYPSDYPADMGSSPVSNLELAYFSNKFGGGRSGGRFRGVGTSRPPRSRSVGNREVDVTIREKLDLKRFNRAFDEGNISRRATLRDTPIETVANEWAEDIYKQGFQTPPRARSIGNREVDVAIREKLDLNHFRQRHRSKESIGRRTHRDKGGYMPEW